jgi:CheY-like chemotaxis protein
VNDNHNIHVLIVEDDPELRKLMARVLRGVGYRVNAVESAHDALTALGRSAFDVVVSDHHLGGMDGVQLLELCRRSFPGTVRVLATADSNMSVAARAVKQAAVTALLRKPCSPTDLCDIISASVGTPRIDSMPAPLPSSRATVPQAFGLGPTSETPEVSSVELSGLGHDLIRFMALRADLGTDASS